MNKHLGLTAALVIAAFATTASAATARSIVGTYDAVSATEAVIQTAAANTAGKPRPKPRPRPNGSQSTASKGGAAVLV